MFEGYSNLGAEVGVGRWVIIQFDNQVQLSVAYFLCVVIGFCIIQFIGDGNQGRRWSCITKTNVKTVKSTFDQFRSQSFPESVKLLGVSLVVHKHSNSVVLNMPANSGTSTNRSV